jgi:hypothetical protein
LIGKNLRKNIVFDLKNQKRLHEHSDSRFQWMTTDHLSQIIFELSTSLSKIKREVFNVGGVGSISVKEMAGLLSRDISQHSNNGDRKHFEIDTSKAGSLFKLKTSKDYLHEILHTI